ncbi:MAG: dockerin type I domain-containing protein [Planctomycetota bacterium]
MRFLPAINIWFPLLTILTTVTTGLALAASPPDANIEEYPPFQNEVPCFPQALLNEPPTVTPVLDLTVLGRGQFQSIQINIDADGNNILGDAANEPSIAVDPTNPNRMVVGWRQFNSIASDFRQAGWAYSHDGGRTWTMGGVLETGVFRSDPVLAADTNGNFYYYSLTVSDNYICHMFKSTDAGVSWVGPIDAYGGDKAWIDIDRTGGPGNGHIYCAWDHAGCCGDLWFTRSLDDGLTYDEPVEIPLKPIWGTVAVGPDGAVYVSGRRYVSGSIFACVRSSNAQDPPATIEFDQAVEVNLGGRLLFAISIGPNPIGLLGQVWLAADHSDSPTHGYLYMLASVDPPGDDPLDVMFARSTDAGATWSPPVRITDEPEEDNSWQWFGTLSVAPNGRLDVVWNDTRGTGADNLSELFYSYSLDAGQTWSLNVPITPVFDSHLGWPQQNKLGDYYHMISDSVGVNLAYAATFAGEQNIYFMRIGDYDCNMNDIGDSDDIANGTSTDFNANGIPDECDGPGDMNCDGAVNSYDIDGFICALSPACDYEGTYPNCDITHANTNGDGFINAYDIDAFIQLLAGD